MSASLSWLAYFPLTVTKFCEILCQKMNPCSNQTKRELWNLLHRAVTFFLLSMSSYSLFLYQLPLHFLYCPTISTEMYQQQHAPSFKNKSKCFSFFLSVLQSLTHLDHWHWAPSKTFSISLNSDIWTPVSFLTYWSFYSQSIPQDSLLVFCPSRFPHSETVLCTSSSSVVILELHLIT